MTEQMEMPLIKMRSTEGRGDESTEREIRREERFCTLCSLGFRNIRKQGSRKIRKVSWTGNRELGNKKILTVVEFMGVDKIAWGKDLK